MGVMLPHSITLLYYYIHGRMYIYVYLVVPFYCDKRVPTPGQLLINLTFIIKRQSDKIMIYFCFSLFNLNCKKTQFLQLIVILLNLSWLFKYKPVKPATAILNIHKVYFKAYTAAIYSRIHINKCNG